VIVAFTILTGQVLVFDDAFTALAFLLGILLRSALTALPAFHHFTLLQIVLGLVGATLLFVTYCVTGLAFEQ